MGRETHKQTFLWSNTYGYGETYGEDRTPVLYFPIPKKTSRSPGSPIEGLSRRLAATGTKKNVGGVLRTEVGIMVMSGKYTLQGTTHHWG